MAKQTKKEAEAKVSQTKTADMDKIREAAVVNLVATLAPKTFSSGKQGFYSQGKITVDGIRYQSQIMLTEITPKS